MKKKAFQKLTALLAVTAMSASLLTGCGSDFLINSIRS